MYYIFMKKISWSVGILLLSGMWQDKSFLKYILVLKVLVWSENATGVAILNRCDKQFIKNRSIGPELTTAKTGPIHLSSLVEIAFCGLIY